MTVIPPHYLDAVAVLEAADLSTDPPTFMPVATATLLGYKVGKDGETPTDGELRVPMLVTNKHVVEGTDELWIRFNQGAGSQRFRFVVEEGETDFRLHPRFDVAVSGINGQMLTEAGAEFDAIPSRAFLDMAGMAEKEVSGGDSVFVLGFPMGIAGAEKKYAVVRGGVIARVDEHIVQETDSFLVDCQVFPGNSGGPVVLAPEAISVTGQPRGRVYLVGIVAGYVPWIDTAVSQQTGRPRATFEENSGLTNVVPLDAVNDLVVPMLEEKGYEVLLGPDPDEQNPGQLAM
jgi:hypothetical protein